MIRSIAVALVALWAAGPAVAAEWNAVVVDDYTLSAGYALGRPGKDEAIGEATRGCREGGGKVCGTTFTREGGCIAFSRNESGSSLGVGMQATIEDTVIEALKGCFDHGKYEGCTVHTNRCASGG